MPVIAPSIIELFTLTTASAFVTVATVVLPLTVTSFKVNSVALDNSNPVLLFKFIVDLFVPSVTPCIVNLPLPVVPRFSFAVYVAVAEVVVKFLSIVA